MSFRDFNATNEPLTCLWCGSHFHVTQPTRSVRVYSPEMPSLCDARTGPASFCKSSTFKRGGQRPGAPEGVPDAWICVECGRARSPQFRSEEVADGEPKARGYLGSEHFCTLRCGYLFGEQFARMGRRLEPRDD
jgi:hypothetical protein